MNHSSVIFFYLLAAFVIFITMRGELPRYLGFLLASPKAAPVQAAQTSPGDLAKGAEKLAQFAALMA